MDNYIPKTGGFCVNIGASDGDDICDQLFKSGYDGLCVEPINVEQTKKYVSSLPGDVKVDTNFATPENIHDILKSVPKDIDFLKIDIDGYDLALTRKIFELGYKPKVIVVEINETISPPVEFEIPYDKEWRFAGDHLVGCSVQSAQNVMNENGYKIVDIIDDFQRNNILAVIGESEGNEGVLLWEKLYKNDPTKYLNIPWNIDVDHWIKDPKICEDDLKKMYFNRKYGTTFKTSLDEEPIVEGPFKDFVRSLLKDVDTVIDVGTWNKTGFSRLVIEYVLETEKNIGLYKLESSTRYFEELQKIWDQSYGNVVKDFAILGHARMISDKAYSPPEDVNSKKRYDMFHFWTMNSKECHIKKADLAFIHVYPDWFPEVVKKLYDIGVRHVAMKKYMYVPVDDWEIVYSDDEYVITKHS